MIDFASKNRDKKQRLLSLFNKYMRYMRLPVSIKPEATLNMD